MTVGGSRRRRLVSIAIYVIMAVLLVVWSLGPILWAVVISLSNQSEMQDSKTILPAHPTLTNYHTLLFDPDSDFGELFASGIRNSVIASFLSIIFVIPIAALSAYAFSRFRFRMKQAIRIGLLLTLLIPFFAVMITLYKLFAVFHLLNTLVGVIAVYVSAFLPLTIWLLNSYFEALPQNIEEAAWIDGCSVLQTMLRVVLPLSMPAILSAALIVFLMTWNQFLIPLILAPTPQIKPVAVTITQFATKREQLQGLIAAGGIVALLPPALIALVFRRLLVRGLAAGATKG
jgi:multiple sugar transport system permease protein